MRITTEKVWEHADYLHRAMMVFVYCVFGMCLICNFGTVYYAGDAMSAKLYVMSMICVGFLGLLLVIYLRIAVRFRLYADAIR